MKNQLLMRLLTICIVACISILVLVHFEMITGVLAAIIYAISASAGLVLAFALFLMPKPIRNKDDSLDI